MKRSTTERLAFPLTFLLKREGEVWASLAVETGVASCGDTPVEAREKLQEAVAGYYAYLSRQQKQQQFLHPLTPEEIDDFKNDPPGEVQVEHYTMLVDVTQTPEQTAVCDPSNTEFIRSIVPDVSGSDAFAAG